MMLDRTSIAASWSSSFWEPDVFTPSDLTSLTAPTKDGSTNVQLLWSSPKNGNARTVMCRARAECRCAAVGDEHHRGIAREKETLGLVGGKRRILLLDDPLVDKAPDIGHRTPERLFVDVDERGVLGIDHLADHVLGRQITSSAS